METLIVMDDVFGFADNFRNFASFLTVGKKCGCSSVYTFCIIYQKKADCKIILSQKKIFYTFPGSVEQSIVLKIISANC